MIGIVPSFLQKHPYVFEGHSVFPALQMQEIHSALDGFISTPDYHISSAIVLSNERSIELKDGILYMPIYYSMFIRGTESKDLILD